MSARHDRELLRHQDRLTLRERSVVEVVSPEERRMFAETLLELTNGNTQSWEEAFSSRVILKKDHRIRYMFCLVANVLPGIFADNQSFRRPYEMLSCGNNKKSAEFLDRLRQAGGNDDEFEDDELNESVSPAVLQNRVTLDWFFPQHVRVIQSRALPILREVAQERAARAARSGKYADPMASRLRSRRDEVLTWTEPNKDPDSLR